MHVQYTHGGPCARGRAGGAVGLARGDAHSHKSDCATSRTMWTAVRRLNFALLLAIGANAEVVTVTEANVDNELNKSTSHACRRTPLCIPCGHSFLSRTPFFM